MYSLLYLVCMDAGLLCMRGAPGRAWDTPEALSTRRSLLWTLWSHESVPCLSATQGSRVGQQRTLQGAAMQCAWKFGVDPLGSWWICRERGRGVSIIQGTPGTRSHSRSLLHPQSRLPTPTSGCCSRGAEPQMRGNTPAPQKATFRLSCALVLSQPSAVSGPSWTSLVKPPGAPLSLSP